MDSAITTFAVSSASANVSITDDPKLLSRIIYVLKSHRPQGIDLMDISREFYKSFQTYLSPKDYNFNNIYEFFKSIEAKTEGSILVAEPNGPNSFKTERLLLNGRAYSKWLNNYKLKHDIKYLETLAKPSLPIDVALQHKARPPFATLPKEAIKGMSIVSYDVDVLHVVTPNEIYIRLHNNDYLYHEIKSQLRFYDDDQQMTSQYVLPEELILPGYFCAVRNPMDWDNWHRALIISTRPEFITLFAIDFGNIITEKRKELRLLKSRMIETCPLAIRVSLYGVAPFTGNKYWPQEAVDYLKSIFKKKITIKRNYSSNKKRIECVFLYNLRHFGTEVFSVSLFYYTDVQKEGSILWSPVYLHEKLIQNGFAQLIFDDFNQLSYEIEYFKEPLRAIKYETNLKSDSPPMLKNENNVFKIKIEPTDTKNKIGSQKLFLTDGQSPEIKINQYFPRDNCFLFNERKLFNEFQLKSFHSFQINYINGHNDRELLQNLRKIYINGSNGDMSDFQDIINIEDEEEEYDSNYTRIPWNCQQFAFNMFSSELDSAYVKYLSR